MNKKSFTIFLIKRIFIFVSIVSFSTLSFNNLIVAIAETEKEEKKYDLRNTSISENKFPDDWFASFRDGITEYDFGYFHRKVQNYIIKNYEGFQREKYFKDGGENGSKGFADLIKTDDDDDITYVWDVKTALHGHDAVYQKQDLDQIDRYVEAGKRTGQKYCSAADYEKDPITHDPIRFIVEDENLPKVNKSYSITFQNVGNGLIFYRFDKLKKDNPQENTAPDSSPDQVLIDNALDSTKKSFETIGKKFAEEIVSEVTEEVIKKVSIALIKNLKAKALDLYVGKEAGKSVFNVPRSDEQLINALTVIMESADVVLSTHKIYKTLEGNKYIELDANSEFYKSLDVFLSDLAGTLPNIDETTAKEMYEQFINQEIDSIDEISGDISDNASDYETAQTQYQRDPLIINFSGTKDIEFTSLDDGINFDLDNNEFAEKTAWIKNHDGFLAIDLNSNGKIDNGGELFGDSFIMPDGNCSKTGFEALSSLDTNKNEKIDAEDAMFGNAKAYTDKEEKNLLDQLIVWFDNNHNGITDDGDELSSLNSLNIDHIDLKYTNDPYNADDTIPEEKGARQEGKSYVYFNDGTKEKSISEFWFKVNNSTTIHDGEVTVGNVKNIEQAIADDETGTLYSLCLAFDYSTDIAEKHRLLKKILYFLTDSSEIVINSRGGNIDARDLHVVEAFMGHEFFGVDGRNPNAPAAEILKDIYRNIEDNYYSILNLKMSFGGYMTVTFEDEDENGNICINFELLNDVIEEMSKENDPETDILIYNLGSYLKTYDKIHGTKCFDKYKEHYLTISPKYQEIIDLIGNTYTFIDTDEDDIYSGSAYNDFVFGESGNNVLNGSSGNDRIYSGFGDDILQGGNGDDRYYFGIYHGNDTVNDTSGNNQIIFTDGYSLDDYDISLSLDGKLVLTNIYTDDSIILNDFIKYPVNYEFISEDEIVTIGGGESREVIDGTDYDDELEASDGFNIFYGKDGNDIINGGANIDLMYGGNGDDTEVLY